MRLKEEVYQTKVDYILGKSMCEIISGLIKFY